MVSDGSLRMLTRRRLLDGMVKFLGGTMRYWLNIWIVAAWWWYSGCSSWLFWWCCNGYVTGLHWRFNWISMHPNQQTNIFKCKVLNTATQIAVVEHWMSNLLQRSSWPLQFPRLNWAIWFACKERNEHTACLHAPQAHTIELGNRNLHDGRARRKDLESVRRAFDVILWASGIRLRGIKNPSTCHRSGLLGLTAIL